MMNTQRHLYGWYPLMCFVGLLFVSCAPTEKKADLGEIYGGVARDDRDERNPVIVIPGIMGSKLRDDVSGTQVWGAFVPGVARPDRVKGARLLAVPMRQGAELASLKDGVRPAGALDRVKVRVLPGIQIAPRAYAEILQLLGAGGYVDETFGRAGVINYGHDHFTCFQFSYDWRLSSAENAKRLHEFIEQKRAFVKEQRRKRFGSNKPVKFDIVAHSMGGLVARYYLRYGTQSLPKQGLPRLTWEGARNVEKVVLVGTPNLGSPEALIQLTKGFQPTPFVPKYDPALIGTMPALYELLPRAKHGTLRGRNGGEVVDLLDDDRWIQRRWGLASLKYRKTLERLLPEAESDQERREIALDHLRKCLANARQFHRALDRPARIPEDLLMVTWVGDNGGKTPLVLEERDDLPRLIGRGRGDGTVPRYSALGDDRGAFEKSGRVRGLIPWSDVNFLDREHLDLTKDANFSDNVLGFLLNQGGSAGLSRSGVQE